MCHKCCSHRSLHLSAAHSCNSATPYHVGLSPRCSNRVLFPGQSVNIYLNIGSASHLISDICTTGLRPQEHVDATWPSEAHLIPKAIAISPTPHSPVGALAMLAPDPRRPSSGHSPAFFKVVIVARYVLLASQTFHRSYPCILVRLLCDTAPTHLSLSINSAFPYLSTTPTRPPSRGVHTRSATKAPSLPRLRSSALMGGLSYYQWRSVHPDVVLCRAQKAAVRAKLSGSIRFTLPILSDSMCFSTWSFRICAILPHHVSQHTRLQMLRDTSITSRLIRLTSILHASSFSAKRPARISIDEPGAVSAPRKRRKFCASPLLSPVLSPLPSKRDATRRLDSFPCSSARGFQSVNLRFPCKGRFKLPKL